MAEQFRRTDPRYERRIEVEIVLEGKRQPAATRNISLGGMYVESASPLPMGATVQVRFHVPAQVEAIEVMGDVRWIEPPTGGNTQTGMGIRFHGLRARDVWALNRYFQS